MKLTSIFDTRFHRDQARKGYKPQVDFRSCSRLTDAACDTDRVPTALIAAWLTDTARKFWKLSKALIGK